MEKAVFLMGSEDRGFPVWQISLLPGQKGMRLAKKGGGSSFAGCGLPPFSAKRSLSPRVSLRFSLCRLPSCPGNVKAGPNHQLNGS